MVCVGTEGRAQFSGRLFVPSLSPTCSRSPTHPSSCLSWLSDPYRTPRDILNIALLCCSTRLPGSIQAIGEGLPSRDEFGVDQVHLTGFGAEASHGV